MGLREAAAARLLGGVTGGVEHLLDRRQELARALDVALGLLLARGDGLVVAALARDLGVLGEG